MGLLLSSATGGHPSRDIGPVAPKISRPIRGRLIFLKVSRACDRSTRQPSGIEGSEIRYTSFPRNRDFNDKTGEYSYRPYFLPRFIVDFGEGTDLVLAPPRGSEV